jgi:deazaflavin-dependent oxidoreductase (nitroreductase family)
MQLQDGSTVVGNLTTIGRKTGQRRTVELRFTYYEGCYYASSSRVKGKHWCQNMLKTPSVELDVKGERFSCTAIQVTDDQLRRYILSLDLRDSPPRMDRVVFAIKPRP